MSLSASTELSWNSGMPREHQPRDDQPITMSGRLHQGDEAVHDRAISS